MDQDKCAKLWRRCSAVKSSCDAAKQLILMFTGQNDEKKTLLRSSGKKTFKCLWTVMVGVWRFRLKEVVQDNTLLVWNASKLQQQKKGLQINLRQHMLENYYMSRNKKKVLNLKSINPCFVMTTFDSTVPWWSRGRSSCCFSRERTIAWALISAHSAIISSSQLVPLVGNRVCTNLDAANQNCSASDSLLRLQVDIKWLNSEHSIHQHKWQTKK